MEDSLRGGDSGPPSRPDLDDIGQEKAETARYIPNMKPGRGIGNGGVRGGSIDDKEESRGRPEAASVPSNM